MIRPIGRTERRVVLAIVVTAALPLLVAMGLASEIIQRISRTAFQPEFGQYIERSLGVYADLVKARKHGMRSEVRAIMARRAAELKRAAAGSDDASEILGKVLRTQVQLTSVGLRNAEGQMVAQEQRAEPMDETKYRAFTVRERLSDPAERGELSAEFVFAVERTRLDEMEAAQGFAQAYRRLESDQRAAYVDRPYLTAFALLFGLTVLFAVVMGIRVVRPVTRRIAQMAAATQPVAAGDLSVRVDEGGRDELAALAAAFNKMLSTLETSRARIEFLQRVDQWQNMARRLAHEIKNPLTPIQLAVEECQQRYAGEDGSYVELLATTRDIVKEEVESLRRLVGEFAAFARLPRSDLREENLGEFLHDQRGRLEAEAAPTSPPPVALQFDLDSEPLMVAMDRTMLYRTLVNLVVNAVQASRAAKDADEGVRLALSREGEHALITVEDDGQGVPSQLRERVFDPYMTMKKDGTGLGLTIAKKVVIDHGGRIEVDASPRGGARFCLRLPLMGSAASAVALAQSDAAPMSG